MEVKSFKQKQSEMTNKVLISKVRHQISEMAKTGGRSHIMNVPPDISDTDMILSELADRYEKSISICKFNIESPLVVKMATEIRTQFMTSNPLRNPELVDREMRGYICEMLNAISF